MRKPNGAWRLAVPLAAVAGGASVGMRPVLGVVAACTVFLGVVVMARPDWATIAAVAVLYSNAAVVAHRVHGLPKPVMQAAGLLVAVALVHHLGVRRREFLLPAALPWVAVFVVVQIVGAIRASEPMIALESVQDFLTGGFFLYLAFVNAIRTRETVRSTLWVVLVVGALLGALGLHQSLTDNFENNYGGFAQVKDETLERRAQQVDEEPADPRLAGPIGEKNFYAQLMLVLVPLGLMISLGLHRLRARVFVLILTGFTLVGATLAVSRGGAVGLVLAILILTALRMLPVRMLLLVAIGIGLLLSMSPRYTERLMSIGSVTGIVSENEASDDVDSATLGRLGANVAAFRVFADHPVLGVGSGMFNTYYREQALETGFRVHEGTRSAHNMFLSTAAEFGIIGFVALFGAVGITLRNLARTRRRMLESDPAFAAMIGGIFGMLVTYLTTGIFLSLAYERYFWFLMALGAAAASTQDEATARPHLRAPSAPRPESGSRQ